MPISVRLSFGTTYSGLEVCQVPTQSRYSESTVTGYLYPVVSLCRRRAPYLHSFLGTFSRRDSNWPDPAAAARQQWQQQLTTAQMQPFRSSSGQRDDGGQS